MHLPFSTSDVIAGVIGFGLVAKGIVGRVATTKPQHRPVCQAEHKELSEKVEGIKHDTEKIITILDERRKI